MANEMEKKLCMILEHLYAASGHQEECAALANDAIQYMLGSHSALGCDIDVRVMKGGTPHFSLFAKRPKCVKFKHLGRFSLLLY